MPCAPIVPDGNVVLAPLEPNLCVVVLGDNVEEVTEQEIRLILGDTVDALREASVDVDRFPARDGCKKKTILADALTSDPS